MVSGGNGGGFVGKEDALLRVEGAVGEGATGGLAIQAAVAAFFAVAADGAFGGTGRAGAVGSDQHVELFRFHSRKASGFGRRAAAGPV